MYQARELPLFIRKEKMLTYNYYTCKIERDFVLKRVEGDCNVDPERTKLIGVMCQGCPHFLKMKKFYRPNKDKYILNLDTYGTFVFCKYHKKDDEGTSDIIAEMYSKFREEAISHFYD